MRKLLVTTSVSLVMFAADAAAVERVTFARRPARAGDQVEQSLSLDMRMTTTLRQGNQIEEKSKTTARHAQRRIVTTTHVESDRAVAVRLRYLQATRQLSATDGAQTSGEPSETPQPVAGKTYRCQRQPGDDGKLAITDEAGHIPPMDEYEIVAQHMDMVGRANPLAEVLSGKSVAVGQTISLPPDVAGRVFSLGEHFGDVSRFELTLEKVEPHEDTMQAVFIARVDATSNNASQMRMQLEGPITVQVNTCRAVQVELAGPIAMSETRGSYSTAYQAIGTGQLKMSVASTYRDAKR